MRSLQFSVNVFETFKRVLKRIIIMPLITVCAMITNGGYVWYIVTDIYKMNDSEGSLLAIVNSLLYVIVVIPPISYGNYINFTIAFKLILPSHLTVTTIVVLQCLYCIDAGLQHYTDMTRGPISVEIVQEVAMIGMDLTFLLESINNLFGTLIVIEYGLNLLGATLYMFLGLTLCNVNYEVRIQTDMIQI